MREGTRTREALVAELGAPRDRVRSRLQFLARAGYVERVDEGGEADRYALRADPENRIAGLFADSHYLVRLAASATLMALAGGFYYGVFQMVLSSHVVAGTAAIGLGALTGWLILPPRRRDDVRPDDPRDSPPLPPI